MQNEQIRHLIQTPDGQELMQLSLELLEEVPWLMASLENWSLDEVSVLRDRVASLVLDNRDPALGVDGFPLPPSDALVSLVASKAGYNISKLSNAAKLAVATIPVVGSLSGMQQHTLDLQTTLSKITIGGRRNAPNTTNHWTIVLRALQKAQAVHAFAEDIWKVYQERDGWPDIMFLSSNDRMLGLLTNLENVVLTKKIARKLNVDQMIDVACRCRSLDAKQSVLATRVQALAEELVNATVLAELSRTFSEEAHSALIRFSQIAGKAKLRKTQLPSKLSQRQRRLRQDYLEAFDKCCRFIPCWILKSSSTCDYLPAEFSLFDLVIIDESSLSDVTVLPGMLRGKQWLIVGDGKQVSPTEAFVSEEQIESLRAALPSGPLETSLLPGQSFFDLCAQAFPSGRVVLNEHFRCEANIISFCNTHFYDGQLVPLRLPMQSERITPSLVDVKVPGGVKHGKTNEQEAEEILRRVGAIVSDPHSSRRTIGVISLMGDEQSRLIRGRLLDSLGPQIMSKHDVLVGDPPAFQGTERDSTFDYLCLAILGSSRTSHIPFCYFCQSYLPFHGVLARQISEPKSAIPLPEGQRSDV
jgi:AAA domain